MLRITIDKEAGTNRLKLEGKLKGAWVLELEQCWQRLDPKDKLVVELTEVEYVDTAGRLLLALMRERGARFVAVTPLMAELVAELAPVSGENRKRALKSVCSLLLAAWILAAAPAPAQDAPVVLDLARAAELASSRNLQIQAGKRAVVTAGHVVEQAKALRYGKVELDASYLRLDDPVTIVSGPVHVPLFGGLTLPVPPVTIAPADLLHVRLEAGLPLFTGGRINNAIAAARAGEKAADALSDDTRAAVVLEAGQLYLGALLARDVVGLNEQALESYRRHLDQARTAYQLGVVANYDVVRAEAAVADQEKRLTEARNRRELVEDALETALDLSGAAPVEITGALFEPPAPQPIAEALAEALRDNPALEALRRKVEALERTVRVEKGEYLPQITAVAGKETVATKIAQTDPNWFAGVQATWTLFDGGARRARVAAKASEAEQARIERRNAAEQVRLAVRSAFLDYESQKSALDSARKAAGLAREVLTLATKRFAAGAGTSLEVLDATVALTAAETGAQSALYQMDAAYLRIHRYIGDVAEVASHIQK